MTAARPGPADPPPSPFVAETDAPKAPTPSRRARQLLQLAHQAVYRLPATYPGFTAAVEVRSDRWTVRGSIDVHCPHGAVFLLDPDDPGHDHDATDGARPSPATVTTVTTMIVDLVSRQFPKRFDELDGRYEAGFRPDLDQPGRRAVQLLGESRRTIRWLDDRGVVATAYRRAGVAHHVDVDERRVLDDTPWLPLRVREARRAEGAADLHHDHADEYLDVEGIHLPLRRVTTVTAHGAGTAPSIASVGPVTIEVREHRHHPRGPAGA
jgi:hypothetical protein